MQRYTVKEYLGRGAYANVYKVLSNHNNLEYAIKLISKTQAPAEYLKKFVPREIDALKRLSNFNHPFICQMREFFETRDEIYLVMKLATGGDLLTYINRRKCLLEITAKKLIAQVLCAVDHIHSHDIVHRDLKCENLLLDGRENVLISDFGFATQQPKNYLLTTFCGSYAYAAPEILAGSTYNGKSADLWSIGVIMYAMINGRLPFIDTTPKNILEKINTHPLIIAKPISNVCDTFIRQMLTINSKQRASIFDLLTSPFLEDQISATMKYIPVHLRPQCLSYLGSIKHVISELSEGSNGISRSSRLLKDQDLRQLSQDTSHKTSPSLPDLVKQGYRRITSGFTSWKKRKSSDDANDSKRKSKYVPEV